MMAPHRTGEARRWDSIDFAAVKRLDRTARLSRGILPFTHLAREGRMTVTIGRRELLADSAAQRRGRSWRAQQPPGKLPTIGYLGVATPAGTSRWGRGFCRRDRRQYQDGAA